jgi:alpha-L-rhamnosidase
MIGTGDDWEASFGPIITSELYDGEVYDARQKPNMDQEQAWLRVKSSSLDSIVPKLFSSHSPPVRCTENIHFKRFALVRKTSSS